jgi:diguanylate cyclase (GGDEF)-like protein
MNKVFVLQGESGLHSFLRISSIVLITLSCLVVGIFYSVTTNRIEEIYAKDTKDTIYMLKEDFLRDTVNNQIRRIDARRVVELDRYSQILPKTTKMLMEVEADTTEEEFIRIFSNHFTFRSEAGVWSALLWDIESGHVIVDTDGFFTTQEISLESLTELEELFAIVDSPIFGKMKALYGVRKDRIDSIVKEAITTEIHHTEFAEDSYIWVNEVLDYRGGENYAIRRIHPNLQDTEGMYLSTSMTDIAGNLPYLEELEGIKKDGEIFFTYFFKRKGSEEIAEKLTYAKLYEEYNWIVAMGIHLEDMDNYIDTTNQKSGEVSGRLFPIFLVILVFLVAGGSAMIIFVERWKTNKGKRELEEQANHDVLTKAFNRRMGLHDLARIFLRFAKAKEPNPAIIVFDIDDFKLINDNYGHFKGDEALKKVSSTILSSIRSTDKLYRWGGDEFLLLCDGVQTEYVEVFCKNLLTRFCTLMEESHEPELKMTLSMGVSYFHSSDSSHLDALERADRALYRAKRNGKNRVELEL